jgi:hypothetical protein
MAEYRVSEEWRTVDGYGGMYQVSNLGRVRSMHNGHRILNPHADSKGYMQVTIGKAKPLVHRMVAMAFDVRVAVPGHQINHINGIKDDNRVCNLEWCNQSYNMRHAFKRGRKPPKRVKIPTEKKRVIARCIEIGGMSDEWIAKSLGVSPAMVFCMRHGLTRPGAVMVP